MEYSSFSVKKYKGISDVNIPVNAHNNNPICLLGLNESGKTTTLEAINLIGWLCKGNTLENGLLLAIRPKGDGFSGNIELSASLKLSHQEKEYIEKLQQNEENRIEVVDEICINYIFIFDNHAFQRKQILFDDIAMDDGNDCHVQLKDFIKENTPDIIYHQDFIFNTPEKITYPTKPPSLDDPADTTLNGKWRDILQDIYSASRDNNENNKFSFTKDVVYWLYEETNKNDDETPKTRLQGMENILNKHITAHWKNIAQQDQSFNSIKIEPTKTKDRYGTFNIRVYSKSAPYKIDERSKGFRWFFTFLLLTEIRKHRKDNTIFLLDEPASNLHPSAQKTVFNALQQLCNKANVIYSTHSPYLLSRDNIRNTFLVMNDADEFDESKITCTEALDLIQDLDNQTTAVLSKRINYMKPILDFICFELPEIAAVDFTEIINEYKGKLKNKNEIKKHVPEIERTLQDKIGNSKTIQLIKDVGRDAYTKLIVGLIVRSILG